VIATGRSGDHGSCRVYRGAGRFVAETQRAGQQLFGGLIAGREPNLTQQAALMPGSVRAILELKCASKRVRCFGQSAGGLLYLRNVVKRLSGVNTLTGNGQGFGLPEQRTFVMRSSGDGGRVLHERLFEVAQPEQHAAKARVRECSRRSDR
jgi:hypothetical protein